MRKLAITIFAACGGVVIAVGLLPHVLDVNHYRPRIQAELQNRLGRPVTLGNIKASLLPPSLIAKDVVISEDPRFGAEAFAEARELDVRVALIPLLRNDLRVTSLRLIDPDIRLIKDLSGEWNYSSLGQAPLPAQPRDGFAPKPGTAPRLSLDHVEIANGRLRFFDLQDKVRNTYDNIDAKLDNFAPGKPFQVDAVVHIAGRGHEHIRVRGTAGPRAAGSAMIPFDGAVDLEQVSLGDLQKVANIAALRGFNGIATGSLKARTGNGVVHTEGSLKIEDPQINATKLGYPVTLDFKLDERLDSGLMSIADGTLKLGPTPVSITGTIRTNTTPVQLDIRVTTRGASLSEIARLAAAAGVAFNVGANVKGTLNADVSAHGAADNPSLNGSLQAAGVEITGGRIRQPVSVPQLNLTLAPDAISSSPFVAKSGGTQLNLQFVLKDYAAQRPSLNASMRANNANLGELLAIAGAYGVPAVEGMSGAGLASLNLTVAGPLQDIAAMAFSGNGRLQDASLSTPSLTKPLNIRSANIRFSQNSMVFENVQASLDQSNVSGNFSVRDFAAPHVQFTLQVDRLDLAAMQQIAASPSTPAKEEVGRSAPRGGAQKTSLEPSLITRVIGNGAINVGTLTYDQLLLNNLKANVMLENGVIRLSPQMSGLYGGQQTGQFVLDTRVTPLAVTVATKLQNVDANKLVSSLSSIKDTLYGSLAGTTNAGFRAAGRANFAQSLNGKLELELTNGRIAKVDLLNELAMIGRFLNAPSVIPQQSFTDVTKLTGTFDVVNGVAQTNDLRAVTPAANLAANGTVNLATGALNMRVTAVMAKDFSHKAGGKNIGGLMDTAVANNKGELVIPIIVTGTYDRPRFAPDVEEIARMRLKNMLPSFGNPGDRTSGILGAVLDGKKNAGQQQQAQPTDPLSDLLNSVIQGRKKKQEQPPPSPPPR